MGSSRVIVITSGFDSLKLMEVFLYLVSMMIGLMERKGIVLGKIYFMCSYIHSAGDSLT